VNFVAFWVYASATFLNIFCAINWIDLKEDNTVIWMVKYGPYIGVGAGLPLVAAGVFLSWRIKQLWLVYDPERSLAFEPFNYFPLIWEEDEPEEEIKDETETSVV
jgi:hypothetical protein